MNAADLFRAGKLSEAIQAIGAELRDHPTDTKRRIFLFELLCFAGELDRAAKHLGVLSSEGADTEIGALLYRSALTAERQREAAFQTGEFPAGTTAPVSAGTLNGRPFQTIEDADPRIGARLEVYVAGEYLLLPFSYIATLHIDPPRYLRDLLWAPARITAAPGVKTADFGEVLVPVLSPFSWKHSDDQVRLGRATDWQKVNDQDIPSGQKLLILDGEEAIPYLEIRHLEFAVPEGAPAGDAIPVTA